MSHLTFSAYPGYGEKAKKDYSYSQAVKIGDLIHCSGQGGWDAETGSKFADTVAAQIEQAFKNVELALQNAGGKGWEQVYRIASYHVGFDAEEVLGPMIGALKQYMPNHQPIWTAIGVEKLAFPEMKVEIEVSAHVPSGNGNS